MSDSSDAEFEKMLSNAKSVSCSRKKIRPQFFSVQPKAFCKSGGYSKKDETSDSESDVSTPGPPVIPKSQSSLSAMTECHKTPKLRLAFLSSSSDDSDCEVIDCITNLCLDDKENTPSSANHTSLINSKTKTSSFPPNKKEYYDPAKSSLAFVLTSKEKANSFLRALSHPEECESYLEDIVKLYAVHYHIHYKKLGREMFHLFNDYVFDNKLPSNMELHWSSRLTSAAGYCHCNSFGEYKTCRILLSSRLLISAEKLRDTLIHELCHAATFLISKENDSHGPFWRCWTRIANITFPDLPLITRCHSYKSTPRPSTKR